MQTETCDRLLSETVDEIQNISRKIDHKKLRSYISIVHLDNLSPFNQR